MFDEPLVRESSYGDVLLKEPKLFLDVGDVVFARLYGSRRKGKLIRFWGDAHQGEAPEIEVDFGLAKTRIFPEDSVIRNRCSFRIRTGTRARIGSAKPKRA